MDSNTALLGLFLITSVIFFPFLRREKLFDAAKKETGTLPRLALVSPLIALLLYLSSLAFAPSIFERFIHYADTHWHTAFTSNETRKLAQLVALFVAACLLIIFSLVHSHEIRRLVWGQKGGISRAFFMFIKGAFICLCSYPLVMLIVQCIHFVVEITSGIAPSEQVALVQLKSLQLIPWLFWTFVIAVVTLIPLVEELLFRGFFQNYLSGLLGKPFGIITSSLLFAFSHYSPLQGITNIELLLGLFLFSCLIGLVYVKEKSLFASIGMHSAFNLFSILLMLSLD